MIPAKGEILCIHYYFPPLQSTAVIRNYHIASTFADYFQHVHVLTSNHYHRFPQQIRPLPERLTTYDIATWDYRLLLSGKEQKDAHLATTKKSNKVYQYLLKIQKSYPFNLLLAEGNLIYIWNAYRKAKKIISEGKITTIYSSFGPYADHFVAYKLKIKFPHLRWIADFRDLQIEPIYKNVIWKEYQRKIERKILSKADLVVCVSEGLAGQLRVYERPTRTIMRGIALRKPEKQFEKFTIAYTGSLYFEYRDPRPLFKHINELFDDGLMNRDDVHIIYAGERWWSIPKMGRRLQAFIDFQKSWHG